MDEFILEILKNVNGKKILGTRDNLSRCFEAMANHLDITKQEAMEIQNQLIDEYELGKVKDEGLVRRMLFLGSNEFDLNSLHKISLFMDDENACPYCGLELNNNSTSCNICGYNLEYEGEPDEEIITEEEVKEFLSDILVEMGKMDKETADILFNPENTAAYYEDDPMTSSYNNPEDIFEFDEDDFYHNMDEDENQCYRLDPSHNCKWDTYDLCFYKSLADLYLFVENIEDIIRENAVNFNCEDNEKIFDELVANGYITKYVIPEFWEKTAENLTKKDLQDILRQSNLKISGNKKELIERIKENVDLEKIEYNSINSFKDFDYTIYLTTPKGEEYLEEYKYIDYFDCMVDEYHYDEFKTFIAGRDDYLQATIDFLELHIEKALENENQHDYLTHLFNENFIYLQYMDDENYFKSLVRLFIAYLNPIDTDNNFFYCNNLIDTTTLEMIRKLNEENDYDIESIIVNEYSLLNHITVPLDELIKNLPTLLSKKTHKRLDNKWRKKYLKHNLADLN